MISQKELLDILLELTKATTAAVDSKEILDSETYDDYGLQLINEKHRLKQISLRESFSKKEKKYTAYLKKWLKNEKEFFLEYCSEMERLKKTQPKSKNSSKKKQRTILDFFNGNEEKVKIFFSVLSSLENENGMCVIDEDKNWLWMPKNSICNCLEALFQLSKNNGNSLVNHSFENKYSELYKVFSNEINFDCNYENFKKWSSDINLTRTFKKRFQPAFRAFL